MNLDLKTSETKMQWNFNIITALLSTTTDCREGDCTQAAKCNVVPEVNAF